MKMFVNFADLAARPGKVDPEEAKREEVLVPIRLEFEVEHHRMREAFVWNLNGRYFAVAYTTLVC
jgi:SNF5 / SMARCB1 / INI1